MDDEFDNRYHIEDGSGGLKLLGLVSSEVNGFLTSFIKSPIKCSASSAHNPASSATS